MDDLDLLRLTAETANWRACLELPELTPGEREVTQRLIDDAEEAFRTEKMSEYKTLRRIDIEEAKHES